MEYCYLHKDLSEEEGDGCPLCECMREKAAAITRVGIAYRKIVSELHRKDESLREAVDMLKESRYAIDFATNYGYKSGTLRNDIETFLSTPEVNHDHRP